MIELLNKLLNLAVREGASDLHLISDGSAKIRVNGVIKNVKLPNPISNEHLKNMIQSSIPSEMTGVIEEEYELDYLYTHAGNRFRVNAYKSQQNYEAVFRTIKNTVVDLKELNIPASVTDLTRQNNGLILVVGATGSGKSTTLAGMVDKINNTSPKVIITIENPVEFLHKSKVATISQREVGIDTKSFPRALRSALRQDPDVILVGEIRDAETAQIALEAAQTGHLVMSTMHANDTADAINRFINLFQSSEKQLVRTMLADTLRGIVGQRLIRTRKGGRVPAVEVLIRNLRVEEIIKGIDQEGTLGDALKEGANSGMMSFDDSLLQLVIQREITVEEARNNCTNLQEFNIQVKRHAVE